MQDEYPETTPDRSRDGRRFAKHYREETTDHSPADVSASMFATETVVDFTYVTLQGSRRTIRAVNPTGPASYNDVPEGFFGFWVGGSRYAYNPDDQRIITISRDGQTRTVAESDQVRSITEIEYPTRAVVVGAIQEDVTVQVFYRSNQSGRIKSMEVEVEHIEGKYAIGELTGHSVDLDARVEVRTKWEREIKTKGRRGRTLGRVVRVEFPRGHRFVVDVHGLKERDLEHAPERIRSAISRRLNTREIDAVVSHDGPIPHDADARPIDK